MSYSHGTRWNDNLVKQSILEVMEKLKISSMPTQTMTKNITGNNSLNNAITRSGGRIEWSKRLNVECKGVETMLGRHFELLCQDSIIEKFDFDVEQMNCNYPYDLLANNQIKIDVKVSKMYQKDFSMYTFNLGKKYPTCDLFVCYCVDDNENIIKTYVIPSAILSGKTQLSVGVKASKYDIYLDGWILLKAYDNFYKKILTTD